MKKRNILKKTVLICLIIYVINIFIYQEKTLNSYKNEQNLYSKSITEETQYKDALVNMKENAASREYIEQIAREKLDMYHPNEKVYIDTQR